MKGIILAAGKGTRLLPLTKVLSKAILPIYNKPMIYYPLILLKNLGIKEVLIIVNKENQKEIKSLFEDKKEFELRISYKTQDKQLGMAHALALARDFAAEENIAVTVCDNIFEDMPDISNFKEGARIFLKNTGDANRYTVAELIDGKLIGLEEKPENPKSNYALTGFYLYDKKIFAYINDLKPSSRGEFELVGANNFYLKEGKVDYRILNGFWIDTGSLDSLFKAAEFIRNNENLYGNSL